MDDVNAALRSIENQLAELRTILVTSRTDGFEASFEGLDRWKKRTIAVLRKAVSDGEADQFEQKKLGSFHLGDPFKNLKNEVQIYDGFLAALADEIRLHPEAVINPGLPIEVEGQRPKDACASKPPVVFIVHGHDELNLRRLRELLEQRWQLEVIEMAGEAGRGRTLIEKFVDEAKRASFAFVLISPDDIVETSKGQYAQARPNVVFELGWFYGRLGRDRTCILFKEGARIHSDLDGVSRVQFQESIVEKVLELEKELVAAKIIR